MTASGTLAVATARSPVTSESRAVLSAHARSFSWAAAFLSPDQTDDAAIVYHLCRMIDDTADEATDPVTAEAELTRIGDELRGAPSCRPVVGAFLDVAARRGIDVAIALELIEGCRSDLHRATVDDDAVLLRYCYRVASTVGLMMCGVLGVTSPAARAFAVDLGIAMQLTNICRDVLEDARNGRVYLPESRLVAHGATATGVLEGAESARDAVVAVTAELLDLAERYYHSASFGLRYIPWRARFAIVVATRIYRAIGLRLRRLGGDPLQGRTVVPTSGKLVEVVRSVLVYSTPRVLGLSGAVAHDGKLHRHLQGLPGIHTLAR